MKFTGYALQLHWKSASVKPLLDIFMKFVCIFSAHVMTLCTRFDICSSGKVKSGEGLPNRVAGFGLNRAYMKIRTPIQIRSNI